MLPVTPTDGEPTHRPMRSWRRRLVAGGLVLVVVLAAVIGLLWADNFEVNWGAVSDAIADFNPVVVIGLMAVLPLFGFSVAIVYLFVGARFGPIAGFPVVVGLTAFHLLAYYWI